MNKNTIITLVIGLIIGVGGMLAVSALTSNDNSKQAATTEQQTTTTDNSSMSMADMNKQLEGLSGDEFDKAFIEMMISHHEGAIDMANLAATRAKHDETKSLSKDIISAQTGEISKMQQWQMDWGYMSSDNSMPGMNH